MKDSIKKSMSTIRLILASQIKVIVLSLQETCGIWWIVSLRQQL